MIVFPANWAIYNSAKTESVGKSQYQNSHCNIINSAGRVRK